MLPNNTLMRYLISGISLVLFASNILGCHNYPDRISYYYKITYGYENNSGEHINMQAYNRYDDRVVHWHIPDGHKIVFPPLTQNWGATPFNLDDGRDAGVYVRNFYADSIIIRFITGDCLIYASNLEERNIRLPQWYNGYKEALNEDYETRDSNSGSVPFYSSHEFSLTWVFTPEDLNEATKCPEPPKK